MTYNSIGPTLLHSAGIQAPNKKTLVDYLNTWDVSRVNAQVPSLQIVMPCGSKRQYQLFDDIPDASVPCDCGNPAHWFITYTEHHHEF